ncbi:MAG: helicase-exonuclease AddAB subunit AddB, partial [Bacillota bacterium]|nr:helicase-exonuclease AddAB subunit AddB [Bacillota bacterium]
MSLRFILGRANSGKSTLIYDEITRLVQSEPDGPPLWLLVPEQATFQAEQALAERLGGIMRVRVVSFQRLAYNVLNSVSGAALVPVGELGRSMLVRKVIEEKKKELKIFARSASQPGFAEKIVSLVSELKRYRVKPDDLASALKNHAQLMQPTLRNKLTDLHTVYACLQDQYDGVSLDSDDSLEWLAEHVRDFDLIRSTTVWLDGFTGFTPQEYAVISALLGMSSVVVALTLDAAFTAAWLEMSHPFYTPWVTYSKLRQASKHLSVACEQQVLEYQEMSNKPRSKPLAYLEQTYLDRQFPPYEGEIGGDICLVRAATRRVEVEAAAREIIRLCRDLGFKMRDICIVVRDISLYEPLLSTVLPVHDIPFFLDKKREVQHHPLLELVRSILEAVLSDFPYEATMRALKTDLFPISRDEVDLLDNFSLSTGLRGSRWIDERPLTLANPETEAKLNVSRDKIAPYLRYIKIAVEKGDTVLDFAQGLYGFLDSLQAGTVLQAWANQAESRTDMDTALLHAQVYQSLLDLLDEMVRTLGTESIPFASFVKVLDAGLSSISLGLIPPSLDQVIIAELGRS